MPTSTLPPKPKRGAPFGNKNRQLHGRYARQPIPVAPPSSAASTDPPPAEHLTLNQEIAYLRAFMLRTAVIGAATYKLGATKDVLRALSLAATALTRLVQTENWLNQSAGAQAQIDDLPRVYDNLQKISEMVLDSLPHHSAHSLDLDSLKATLSPQSMLEKLSSDLDIDLTHS